MLLVACGRRSAGTGFSLSGPTSHPVNVGGESREYLLFVPSTPPPASGYPLVLNLHGFSATASQQEALSGMSQKAQTEGFLVAYPDADRAQAWRVQPRTIGNPDVEFLLAVIEELKAQYPVDPRRVFVTGISNGGGLTHRMACDASDRVAAIASVSGAYLLSEACSPSRPIPVLAFHGTGDSLAPYAGQGVALPPIPDWAAGWASRNGCQTEAESETGPNYSRRAWQACAGGTEVVVYTIDDGGHMWPGAAIGQNLGLNPSDLSATDLIWEFFSAHPMP